MGWGHLDKGCEGTMGNVAGDGGGEEVPHQGLLTWSNRQVGRCGGGMAHMENTILPQGDLRWQ